MISRFKNHITFLFGAFVALQGLAQEKPSGMSEMRDIILQYQADNGNLTRKYTIKESDEYYARFIQLHGDWLKKLKDLPFDAFGLSGEVDYVLLRNAIEREEYQLQQNKKEFDQVRGCVRFSAKILPMVQVRRRGALLDPAQTAATFNELRKDVKASQQEIEKLPKYSERLSIRAAAAVQGYKGALADLFKFYKIISWFRRQRFIVVINTESNRICG